jgi:S-DNA-T family DNA segregation ATPase FtsK/SpoIIIE
MAKKLKSAKSDPKVIRQRQVLFGGGLMLLALLLAIAFVSYLVNWKTDFSTLGSIQDKTVEAKNILNKLGAYISHFFIYKGVGTCCCSFSLSIGFKWISIIF